MRVLHVTDTYLPVLGGIEVLVDDLSTHQRHFGYQTRVLTATPQPLTTTRDNRTIRVNDAVLSDVTGLLRRYQPDVVHCHSSIVSPLAWRAARAAAQLGIPVLTTMHSIVPKGPVLQTGLRRLAALMPETVTWSAVSSVAADLLQPIVGREVRVLPNGIDTDACRPAHPGENDVPVMVSVMRLARRKRPLDLVATLARIAARTGDRPWKALIVGDGPQRAAVTRAVARAGLTDRVQLTGRLTRPQVLDLLTRADLYLAPARLESFGIAALEARCAGLPVVAMRGGGVGEFVQEGVNGFLVQDDREMADRAGQLLGDPALLQRLGAAGRADPPDLGWPRVVERTLEAYRAAGVRGVPVPQLTLLPELQSA